MYLYFGHKYVKTGPNCSHEIDTFLKYHMPLTFWPITTSLTRVKEFVP